MFETYIMRDKKSKSGQKGQTERETEKDSMTGGKREIEIEIEIEIERERDRVCERERLRKTA